MSDVSPARSSLSDVSRLALAPGAGPGVGGLRSRDKAPAEPGKQRRAARRNARKTGADGRQKRVFCLPIQLCLALAGPCLTLAPPGALCLTLAV